MPRTKERTPELRDRILAATVAVLATEGLPAVTARRVARSAETSVPAVYELFGDKAGLVRALFFEGFGTLGRAYEDLVESDDPLDDLTAVGHAFRRFAVANPELFAVMFNQPFAVFRPSSDEYLLGTATRSFLVDRIQRCIDVGRLQGDAVDIAHGMLGLMIGLAGQEVAGWLGSTDASRDRRWEAGLVALLTGFR